MEAQLTFDERTDYFIARYGVDSYLFPRLDELKIDGVAFVTAFWKQHNKQKDINTEFVRYGFKYNYLFNERLGRPLDHPTWRTFVLDCLRQPMEKEKVEIDRGLFARAHPGKPLPPELSYRTPQ